MTMVNWEEKIKLRQKRKLNATQQKEEINRVDQLELETDRHDIRVAEKHQNRTCIKLIKLYWNEYWMFLHYFCADYMREAKMHTEISL